MAENTTNGNSVATEEIESMKIKIGQAMEDMKHNLIATVETGHYGTMPLYVGNLNT